MLGLDKDNFRLTEGSRFVPLSATDFIVMNKLFGATGQFVPEEVLTSSVWRNAEREPSNPRNILAVYIWRLRNKMLEIGSNAIIDAGWRRGYRLLLNPTVGHAAGYLRAERADRYQRTIKQV